MRNRIAALLTALFSAGLVASASAADISLERITADPPLAGRLPRQAEISPGGAWVTYLQPSAQDSEQLELWAQPSAGGAPRKLASATELLKGQTERLTEAEKMALERKRISQRGITSYQWCGDGDQALIFPLSGDLYLLRLGQPDAQRLTRDEAVPEQDPRCSPDGRQIAYVKGGNVWVQSLEGKGAPRALTRSAWGQPPTLALRGLDEKAEAITLPSDAPDPLLAQIAPRPQPLNIKAADGVTPLNVFFLPPLVHKPGLPGKYPLIVMAYGGPHANTVNWGWHKDSALLAYWQRQGYGLLLVDTRGMAQRDRDFTRAHHRAFGKVEVEDLFAVVQQLPVRLPRVDMQRIGFWGWSYGGYLAARAMLDANTPFAAAVGVAPPTDWMLYDTAYTERYLGMPDGGKAAPYRDANLTLRAAQLSKPLLLVHGTADDNVLFDNSLKLIEALQNEGKLFDTLIYPGKAHGIAGKKARLHLYRSMDAFFTQHLKP